MKNGTKTILTNENRPSAEHPAPVRWLAAFGVGAKHDTPPAKEAGAEFESLVYRYYRALYQFAFSLTRNEPDACDLTQQTFYIWATKGHQLRDVSKVKTWLFTTLHREFLRGQRRQQRHPEVDLDQSAVDLPTISPTMIDELDAATVVQSLEQVEELYQAPVALFYLENCSYKEIADILDVPIGTVQSRLARGKAQLQQIVMGFATANGEQRG